MSDSANDPRLLYWLGWTALVLIVFLTVTFAMTKAAQGDSFKELIVSNNLALASDLIFAANGEFELRYSVNSDEDSKSYIIQFIEPCLFNVFLEDSLPNSGIKVECANDLGLEKEYATLDNFNDIILKKIGNKFLVRGE